VTTERRQQWIHTLAVLVPVLIALLGILLRAEHRQTMSEQGLLDQQKQIIILNQTQKIQGETLARVTALLEVVCKRHEIEDEVRADHNRR